MQFGLFFDIIYTENKKERNDAKMREKIVKRLHQLQMMILTVNDKELDKIAIELVEIEKKLISLEISKKNKKTLDF